MDVALGLDLDLIELPKIDHELERVMSDLDVVRVTRFELVPVRRLLPFCCHGRPSLADSLCRYPTACSPRNQRSVSSRLDE